MKEVIEIMRFGGIPTAVIAVGITVLTGVIKLPIKRAAAKTSKPTAYTKYITFLPVILGFLLSMGYALIFGKKVFVTDKNFYYMWLSSASMSLAIYAFIEKFIPSEKKIMSEKEWEQNRELIAALQAKLCNEEPRKEETEYLGNYAAQKILETSVTTKDADKTVNACDGVQTPQKIIVLRGKHEDKAQ